MTTDQKMAYRRKRNGVGWVIAACWVGYWFLAPTDGGFVSGAGHVLGILFALVTFPLAFLISHYIARAMVETEAREQASQQQARAAAQAKQAEGERVQRLSAINQEASEARSSIDRGEFIRKLGAVRDYLAVLATTNAPDRRLMIEQSIAQELRELVAKHDPSALRAMVGDDLAIRMSLTSAIDALAERGPLPAEAQILQRGLA